MKIREFKARNTRAANELVSKLYYDTLLPVTSPLVPATPIENWRIDPVYGDIVIELSRTLMEMPEELAKVIEKLEMVGFELVYE